MISGGSCEFFGQDLQDGQDLGLWILQILLILSKRFADFARFAAKMV